MSEVSATSVCPTCGQQVKVEKKPRGRPKIVEDYKERKREYNKRYYDKMRERLKTAIELEKSDNP